MKHLNIKIDRLDFDGETITMRKDQYVIDNSPFLKRVFDDLDGAKIVGENIILKEDKKVEEDNNVGNMLIIS